MASSAEGFQSGGFRVAVSGGSSLGFRVSTGGLACMVGAHPVKLRQQPCTR